METDKITGKQILIQQVFEKYGFSPSEDTIDSIYEKAKGDSESVDVTSFKEVFCDEYNLDKDDEELIGYFNTIASSVDDDSKISIQELETTFEVEQAEVNTTYKGATKSFEEDRKNLDVDGVISKYKNSKTDETKYLAGTVADFILKNKYSEEEQSLLKEFANNLDYSSRVQNIKNNPPKRIDELSGQFLQGDKSVQDTLKIILEAASIHEENLKSGMNIEESLKNGAITYDEAMYFISQIPDFQDSDKLISVMFEDNDFRFDVTTAYIDTLFNIIGQNDEMQSGAVVETKYTPISSPKADPKEETDDSKDEPKDPKDNPKIDEAKVKEARKTKADSSISSASKVEDVSKTIDDKTLNSKLLYNSEGIVDKVVVDDMLFDFSDDGLKNYETSMDGNVKVYKDSETQTEVKEYYGADGVIASRKVVQGDITLIALYNNEGKIEKIKGSDLSIADEDSLWLSEEIKAKEDNPVPPKTEGDNSPKEGDATKTEGEDGADGETLEMMIEGSEYTELLKNSSNQTMQAYYQDARNKADEIINGDKKAGGITKILKSDEIEPIVGIAMLEMLNNEGYGEYVQQALKKDDRFLYNSLKKFTDNNSDVETSISFYKAYINLQKDDDINNKVKDKKYVDIFINIYKQAQLQKTTNSNVDAVEYVKANLISPEDLAVMIQKSYKYGNETEKLKALMDALDYENKVKSASVPDNADNLKAEYIKPKNEDTLKNILEGVTLGKISKEEALYLLYQANQNGSTLQGRNQLITTFRSMSKSDEEKYIKVLFSLVS